VHIEEARPRDDNGVPHDEEIRIVLGAAGVVVRDPDGAERAGDRIHGAKRHVGSAVRGIRPRDDVAPTGKRADHGVGRQRRPTAVRDVDGPPETARAAVEGLEEHTGRRGALAEHDGETALTGARGRDVRPRAEAALDGEQGARVGRVRGRDEAPNPKQRSHAMFHARSTPSHESAPQLTISR
jgi:hypothetical protein